MFVRHPVAVPRLDRVAHPGAHPRRFGRATVAVRPGPAAAGAASRRARPGGPVTTRQAPDGADGGCGRLEPGVVLRLAEPDYLYGVGVLCLRLTSALDLQRLAALEWVRIVADEILWTGEIAPSRDVVVRVAAIPAAVRPVGWLPDSAHRYRTGSTASGS